MSRNRDRVTKRLALSPSSVCFRLLLVFSLLVTEGSILSSRQTACYFCAVNFQGFFLVHLSSHTLESAVCLQL